MTITKKTFFVQFSHFFTGQAAGLLLGFITFPLLTRLLSIEQYGILGLVTNTIAITVVFAKAGLSDGIIRFHDEYTVDIEKQLTFSSTVFIIGLLLAVAVFCCYLAALPTLFGILHIKKQFQLCFFVMALLLLIRPVRIIFMNLLRVNGKTITYNTLNLINKIVSVFLGLLLLIFIVKELYGYFIGLVISEYIIFFVLLSWFFKKYTISLPSVSIGLAKQLMLFGVPLLVTELAYMLLTYADRYMILFYHGEQELGIYSVGYNLAMYVAQLVTFSVSYAIVPLYVKVYSERGREETENFLSDCFYYLLILVLPVCFGYAAVNRELFVSLASDKYIEAASFSPVIVVATIIFGMNSLLNAGLYLHKKSWTILLIITIGLVLNVLCNFILLPKFHVMGAALATLIACIATSILTILFSFRYLVVRIRKGIVYHLLLSIIMYYCVIQVASGRVVFDLFLKIFLGSLIVLSGVFFKERALFYQVYHRIFR